MKSWSSEHRSAAMAGYGWEKDCPSKKQCFRHTTWGLAVKSYEEDASKADVQTFFCKLMKKEAPRLQHDAENLAQNARSFASFVCNTLYIVWILQYQCSGIRFVCSTCALKSRTCSPEWMRMASLEETTNSSNPGPAYLIGLHHMLVQSRLGKACIWKNSMSFLHRIISVSVSQRGKDTTLLQATSDGRDPSFALVFPRA